MADSSMFPLPSDLPKELGLMLADILPTGFSVAYNAKRLADEERELLSQQGGSKEGVVVVIGCGPVSRDILVPHFLFWTALTNG